MELLLPAGSSALYYPQMSPKGLCGERIWRDLGYWFSGYGRDSSQSPFAVKGAVRFGSKGELKLYNIFEDPGESIGIDKGEERQLLELQNYLDTVRTSSPFWPMPDQTTPLEPVD